MHVAVLGAGTMGRDIAHVCAVAGHEVTLRDVDESVLGEARDHVASNLDGSVEREKLTKVERDAALDRLTTTTDLDALAGAELAVEAVPEDIDLKHAVLSEVDPVLDDDALVGTNTSSLSVTSVMDCLDDPSRGVGLHFFNPAYIMGLVEVVLGERTSEGAREQAESFVADVGKEAVTVTDTPGFASSRLGVALGCEAMRMVESGVADPADIDAAMELGYRHPMGPLELTDVVGLDVRLDILEYLREELGERFKPPQVLKRKVRAGKLGKKRGEGFYVWEDGEPVK
ncbi:3-hydroxybutyryl-CoA dehydrogenase [Halosegnis rubeus]|jgi:3-hydroxybutyryl-CoA dehydrogenase|uniref:3-hydroxybutyryl-CoA dehydrogenase n=1 Tax=Halosegnis rubeus TaxID=2212850 RepID=A0A5N5U8Q1_9EURY|nr:3-hydroxyacyl-CoA dehydrogenase family protein [Halosegnis rubeus]KAB7513800.1 3-hydroxybutyryl-CoA dehydrogenase [Halosegnis rubeus]KAB7514201.1 3-hydroxybutyryl-CoA dehydrogenase [Halosegnis rubeus]KAB7518949.1 3-hydroxybutyryl-CoA dehydrogenase [Halosegnis rubeus]